jgi:hypothetical protein
MRTPPRSAKGIVLALTSNKAQVVLRHDSQEGYELLGKADLSAYQLKDVCGRILARYNEATPNDAKTFPGTAAYFAAVRGLRDVLAPAWVGKWENSLELVVNNSNDGLRILVSSGDENTGIPDKTPQTKNHKGERTKTAVNINQMAFPFMKGGLPGAGKTITLIMLYYINRKTNEIRAELSMPIGVDPRTLKVSGWSLRIILPSIEFDDHAPLPAFSDTPNTEFGVERKNGK